MKEILATYGNYILTVAFLSWVTAQLLKTIFTLIASKKLVLERMFGAGGMPSAHTASVCSMVIAISKYTPDGYKTPEFAVAFILAAIVMYDAAGVRRAAGEHAKMLNRLTKDRNEDDDPDNDIEVDPLKEFLGHTPLEVLGGALLGILIAMIVPVF